MTSTELKGQKLEMLDEMKLLGTTGCSKRKEIKNQSMTQLKNAFQGLQVLLKFSLIHLA